MSEKGYTAFEEHLKASLENYEAEYNPAEWAGMEQNLDKIAQKARYAKAARIGGAGIAAVVVTVLLLNYFNSSNQQTAEKSAPALKQNEARKTVTQEEYTPVIISAETHFVEEDGVADVAEPGKLINESTDAKSEHDEADQAENKEQTTEAKNEDTEPSDADVPAVTEPPVRINAKFSSNIKEVCAPGTINFRPEEPNNSYKYYWNFGDGNYSKKLSPNHIYQKAGAYSVVLTVYTENGKKKSHSVTDMITVHPAPETDFDYRVSSSGPFDPSVSFTNKSSDAKKWVWSFGDGKTSDELHPKYVYQKKGTYKVQLTATSDNGCTSTGYRYISIDSDYNLLTPNGFSPNGDGINDTWFPVALLNNDDYADFTITVIDPKTGQVVFASNNRNHIWDGRKQGNGMVKPYDVYGWIARVKDKNGATREYGGTITITE